MRKGFKILIALLVVGIVVAYFAPAVMMALQGGHP